jgi:hypothetical protein
MSIDYSPPDCAKGLAHGSQRVSKRVDDKITRLNTHTLTLK